MQTRKADGLEIRYTESNAHNEPSLLLLSPWPESIYAWEQLATAELGGPGARGGPSRLRALEGRVDLFSPQAMGRTSSG